MSVGVFKDDNPPKFFIDLLKIGLSMKNKVVIGIFKKVVGVGNLEIYHGSPEVE